MPSSLNDLADAYLVQALFATISYRLEPQGRGTRFPIVMNRLYAGGLKPPEMLAAAAELDVIARELQTVAVDRAIASLDTLRPFRAGAPHVDERAADLFHYFLARDGRPLVTALRAEIQAGGGADSIKFDTPEARFERRTLIVGVIVMAGLVGYWLAPTERLSNIFLFAGLSPVLVLFVLRNTQRFLPRKRQAPLTADIEMPIVLSLKELEEGTTLTVTPPALAKSIVLQVPRGLKDGARLRLPGEAGRGDLYLIIRVRT